MLIILSAVEGLYESFDHAEKKLKLVRRVSKITNNIHAMTGKVSKSGKGGMISKIDAAKIMLSMNSDMVISKGDAIKPLIRLKKSSTSTWFKK